MKATFNNIVDQLVKVLTDKAESAQYYSDNEQYTGICGWCGIMSPESRPAYIKTFGKDTTEAAEAKAREIIAEKEAARQRTKYAQHAQEADRLEGVPAVGGFFWADNSGLKCDGGRGLFEELHALTCYTHAAEKPARLCCVEQIINVSEEDFARPGLADELVTRHNLQGFARSEDVDDSEDMNAVYNDPEKLATFYTVGTLVVSPSGKYYLIDSEGYNYARYIYVPIEWPEMFADEAESIKAAEEARKAEEERQAAEEKAQRLAEYRKRCAKWLPLMRNVEKMEQNGTASARKIDNARKANILAMCSAAFPGVKFSVSVRRGWGADFELTWTDGPTVEEFNEKTDLNLFCSRRDTFNGWDDSTGVEFAEFSEFADLTMGSNGGDIDTVREMSDEARAELLAQIFAAVPAADNRNKYGYTEPYTYTDKEAEAVAAALGVDVFDIFAHGYAETADTIARRAWNVRSYVKTTTPEPTDPKPGKAQAANSTDTTDEAPAEGLELVETAEGVAVVGDSRITYRNRKQIKAHGASWNNEAKQWQATDSEAVARLRQWFGASATQTTEADTINENDREKALFVIFAACEIGRLEWHTSGYYTYTDATAEDWGTLEAVAPEVVKAWREAGNPINRNECARLYGEELTKEAEDAHTVARHRAKYCEEWRDELREIWAIYKDLTAIESTTTDTNAHAEEQEQEQHTHTAESEQPDPQEQTEQQNAEEVERVTRFAALLTDVFTMFEEIATAAAQEAQRAKEAVNKQAEAEQLRADIAQMSAQVAKMAETLRTMSERLATIEAEAKADSHTGSTADTGTASDNEPQRAEERPDSSKNKPDTLNMLKAAARHAEQLTEVNEHTEALLARLYVLAAIGLRVRSLIKRVKAIEAAHGRGYLTIEEASERYEISQEAERRAALYLTPEEFRALYRHDPQPDSQAA